MKLLHTFSSQWSRANLTQIDFVYSPNVFVSWYILVRFDGFLFNILNRGLSGENFAIWLAVYLHDNKDTRTTSYSAWNRQKTTGVLVISWGNRRTYLWCLVSLSLTLKKFYRCFLCFHCWLGTSKYRLDYWRLTKIRDRRITCLKIKVLHKRKTGSFILACSFTDALIPQEDFKSYFRNICL